MINAANADVAWGDEIAIDVDAAGTGAMGLGVILDFGGIQVISGAITLDAIPAVDVCFTPAGSIAATDVQAAIEEVAAEAGGGGGLFDAYALLRDEKAANTGGGTFTSGAWRTRDLNTESFDPGGIVSLSANRFTLAAGSYFIYARCPAYFVLRHKAKLVADPAGTPSDAIIGSSAFTQPNPGVVSDSVIMGRVSPGSSTAYEIQHRCEQTLATIGFGVAANLSVIEVYTEVQIWREA